MLLRYPFSIAVVALAFAVSGGMYLVLRNTEAGQRGRTIDLSRYPAATDHWKWQNGTPGFLVRTGREDWNISQVRRAELPHGARLLNAQRNGDALSLLVARGRCIGAGTAGGLTWFCPPQLDRDVAFVVVDAIGSVGSFFPINFVVSTRGDVQRVVVRNPAQFRTVHRDNTETIRYGEDHTVFATRVNWGTFADSISDAYRVTPAHPWRMQLDFYGASQRLLASRRIVLAEPGTQLVVVRP